MDDNWIAKEFMSLAYNAANVEPGENAKNKNPLLAAKETKDWDVTFEEIKA